eukprot:CAMPEP_0198563606 /NCGR_PEP_ID=MMETSP1462-20131121/98984_1 /TAXON_ID=1333877 /ORGANISM="Brandtodinium nutriculum, Strain RCC3387" /LENGTH=52 /DNA_ID=CAMNT_0044294553 /DNA_START=47 /DNA_END=202 /DNA_ORIENTATION=+
MALLPVMRRDVGPESHRNFRPIRAREVDLQHVHAFEISALHLVKEYLVDPTI